MENVNWMREKNSCRDAQQEEIGEEVTQGKKMCWNGSTFTTQLMIFFSLFKKISIQV